MKHMSTYKPSGNESDNILKNCATMNFSGSDNISNIVYLCLCTEWNEKYLTRTCQKQSFEVTGVFLLFTYCHILTVARNVIWLSLQAAGVWFCKLASCILFINGCIF